MHKAIWHNEKYIPSLKCYLLLYETALCETSILPNALIQNVLRRNRSLTWISPKILPHINSKICSENTVETSPETSPEISTSEDFFLFLKNSSDSFKFLYDILSCFLSLLLATPSTISPEIHQVISTNSFRKFFEIALKLIQSNLPRISLRCLTRIFIVFYYFNFLNSIRIASRTMAR